MTQMPTDFFGDDVLDGFYERADQVLSGLEDAASTASTDSFQQFRRDLHSLKGNAQVYGVQDVDALCHRLEDMLAGHEDWSAPLQTQAQVYLAHLGVLLRRARAAL